MRAFASDVSIENMTQVFAYSLDGISNNYAPIGRSFVIRVKSARGDIEEHEDERDSHHPSCCGACDECLRICWGYHGPERRLGLGRRRADIEGAT